MLQKDWKTIVFVAALATLPPSFVVGLSVAIYMAIEALK